MTWITRGAIALALLAGFSHGSRAEDALVSQANLLYCEGPDDPHVRWVAEIGPDSGPVAVIDGRVLIGTLRRSFVDPFEDNYGVFACFDAATGKPRWRKEHARLGHIVNDNRFSGIRCAPVIDRGRAYYVSNRGELTCLELEGMRAIDGVVTSSRWQIDMVETLGVFKRDTQEFGSPLPSPLVDGDLVYTMTGNGSTLGASNVVPDLPLVPRPDAPSILAADASTGELKWKFTLPGAHIVVGQFCGPVVVPDADARAIVFPAGDGVLYAFDGAKGELLWSLDCNREPIREWGGRFHGTRTSFAATPTVAAGKLIVPLGLVNDIFEPEGQPVVAVAIRGENRDKAEIVWRFHDPDFDGSVVPVIVEEGIAYIVSRRGWLFAVDAHTGAKIWSADLGLPNYLFAAPIVHAGKLYVPTESDILVLATGREKKVLGGFQFDGSVLGTPAISDGTLFVPTTQKLMALRLPKFAQDP